VIDALDCIRVCVRSPSRAEVVSDAGLIGALFSGLEVLSSSWRPSYSSPPGRRPEQEEGEEREALRSERRRRRSALIDSLLKCMTNAAVQFPVYVRAFESPRHLNFLVEVS
jgi:hypothetical protein